MSQKLYMSEAWLKLRFVQQRKSIAVMAQEARVSEMTIRRALQAAGLL